MDLFNWTNADWEWLGIAIIAWLLGIGIGVWLGWGACKDELNSLLAAFEQPDHWKEP